MNAKSNRENMPTVAGVVDQFRAMFGDGVRVTYAQENGIEIGKKPVDVGVVVPTIGRELTKRKAEVIPTTTLRNRNTRRP